MSFQAIEQRLRRDIPPRRLDGAAGGGFVGAVEMKRGPAALAPFVRERREFGRVEAEEHQLLVGGEVEIGGIGGGEREEDFGGAEITLSEMGRLGDAGEGEGDGGDVGGGHSRVFWVPISNSTIFEIAMKKGYPGEERQ